MSNFYFPIAGASDNSFTEVVHDQTCYFLVPMSLFDPQHFGSSGDIPYTDLSTLRTTNHLYVKKYYL